MTKGSEKRFFAKKKKNLLHVFRAPLLTGNAWITPFEACFLSLGFCQLQIMNMDTVLSATIGRGVHKNEIKRALTIPVNFNGGAIQVHPVGTSSSKLNQERKRGGSVILLGQHSTPLRYKILLKFRCFLSIDTIHRLEMRGVGFRPHATNLKDGDQMIQVYEPDEMQHSNNKSIVRQTSLPKSKKVCAASDILEVDSKNPSQDEVETYKMTLYKSRVTFRRDSHQQVEFQLKGCLRHVYGLYPSTVKLNRLYQAGKSICDAKHLKFLQSLSIKELRKLLTIQGIPHLKKALSSPKTRANYLALLMLDPRRFWGLDRQSYIDAEESTETGSDSSSGNDDWR